jgi:hypothetical protein
VNSRTESALFSNFRSLKAEGDKHGNTATRTRRRSHRPPTRLRSHKFRPRLCTTARVPTAV